MYHFHRSEVIFCYLSVLVAIFFCTIYSFLICHINPQKRFYAADQKYFFILGWCCCCCRTFSVCLNASFSFYLLLVFMLFVSFMQRPFLISSIYSECLIGRDRRSKKNNYLIGENICSYFREYLNSYFIPTDRLCISVGRLVLLLMLLLL